MVYCSCLFPAQQFVPAFASGLPRMQCGRRGKALCSDDRTLACCLCCFLFTFALISFAASAVSGQSIPHAASADLGVFLNATDTASEGSCDGSGSTISCTFQGSASATIKGPGAGATFRASAPNSTLKLSFLNGTGQNSVLTFQGPFTLITDLAVPRNGSQGYYLVPNPSSSPLFTAAGLPLNNSTAVSSLSLIYNNITVLVPCSTLQLYITATCQQGVDSSVLINQWGILYRQFTGSMVNATNVNMTCGSRLTPPAFNLTAPKFNQSCSSVSVYTGAQLMQAVSDAVNWPQGTYFNIYVMNNISLASVLPYTMYNWPDFRNHPYIKCRLYIIGVPGRDGPRPELDLALRVPTIDNSYPETLNYLKFQGLTLANLPAYCNHIFGPVQQLTAYVWFLSYQRFGGLIANNVYKSPTFEVENSTLLLPGDEMYYWTYIADSSPQEQATQPLAYASNFINANGTQTSGPVTRNQSVTFSTLRSTDNSTLYRNVTFLNSELHPPAVGQPMITFAGIPLLKGWDPGLFNLKQLVDIYAFKSANLQLGNASAVATQEAYYVLHSDIYFVPDDVISRPITFQPITIIGSVLQPQNRLFDLMALPPCVILANEATVTLSSMILINAAPLPNSVVCGAAALSQGINCTRGSNAWAASGMWPFNVSNQLPAASPPDLESALGGLTSVLWVFRFSRSSSTSIRLINVTIMVPDLEIQAIRELATTGATRVNLPSSTLALLKAQLAGQVALPAAFPPGGLYFPTFSWFGIQGRDVYIGPYIQTYSNGNPWANTSSTPAYQVLVQRVPNNLTTVVMPDGPLFVPLKPPSPPAPPLTPSLPPSPANSPLAKASEDSSAPGVSPGAIVGLSIGIAVVVLMGTFGMLWCVKAHKQKRDYSMPTHKGEEAKLGHKKRHQLSLNGSGSTAHFLGLFSSKQRSVSDQGKDNQGSSDGDGSSIGIAVITPASTGLPPGPFSTKDQGSSSISDSHDSGSAPQISTPQHSSAQHLTVASQQPGSKQGGAPRGICSAQPAMAGDDDDDNNGGPEEAPWATGGITPAGQAALARMAALGTQELQKQPAAQRGASPSPVAPGGSQGASGGAPSGTTGDMSSEALSSPAAPKSTAAQEGSASEEQATTLGPRLPTRGLAPVAGEADEEQEWSLKSGPEGQQQKNKEKLDPREELQRTLLRVQAEAGDHMVVELIRELGKGSYGVVFQGIWHGLRVAVKRLVFSSLEAPEPGARDARRRRAALHEAALNASLAHPNIVATYSYSIQELEQSSEGIIDWQLLLIQEFCDVGSLYGALQGQRLWSRAAQGPDMPLVLNICMDITAGMNYIHDLDIIHGDLKLDNILLRNTGKGVVAKVADFGMAAKLPGNRTHLSNVMHGTPLYIAPEVLQSNRCSKASDVYSFGVVCWELLHGRTAWAQLLKVAKNVPHVRQMQYIPGLLTFKEVPGWGPAMEPHLAPLASSDTPPLPEPPPGAKLSLLLFARLAIKCLSMDATKRPTFAELQAELAAIAQQVEKELQLAK